MFHIQRFQVSLPLPRLVKIKEAPFTGTLCKWKWCGFWMFPRYLLCDCVTKPSGTGSVFALLWLVFCALVWSLAKFWNSVFHLASLPLILGFPAFRFWSRAQNTNHSARQPFWREQTLGSTIYIYENMLVLLTRPCKLLETNLAKRVFFLILQSCFFFPRALKSNASVWAVYLH